MTTYSIDTQYVTEDCISLSSGFQCHLLTFRLLCVWRQYATKYVTSVNDILMVFNKCTCTIAHLTQLMQVSKDIVGWWDIVPNVCQESVLLPPVKMPFGQQEDNACQEKL